MARTSIIMLVLIISVTQGMSQSVYRGIVVDSLTLAALQGVHIQVKNKATGTRTTDKGVFSIFAQPADTLVISMIGYNPVEFSLLFEESGILIRLSEKVNMLNEITVMASRITEITRTYRALPKPLEASALANPFDYFSKWQREKRKLKQIVDEHNRTFVYTQVVNDPELREQLMEEFNLSEPEFFELLVKFNSWSGNLAYSTDSHQIIASIKNFFYQSTR